MKVYLFYKKMKDDKNGEILYGVTNNKKYAKKFMKERNMKNFRIEIEEMEKDEYANYCNDNDHRASVLQEFQLATVKDGKHTFHDFYNNRMNQTQKHSYDSYIEYLFDRVFGNGLKIQGISINKTSFASYRIRFYQPTVLSVGFELMHQSKQFGLCK